MGIFRRNRTTDNPDTAYEPVISDDPQDVPFSNDAIVLQIPGASGNVDGVITGHVEDILYEWFGTDEWDIPAHVPTHYIREILDHLADLVNANLMDDVKARYKAGASDRVLLLHEGTRIGASTALRTVAEILR